MKVEREEPTIYNDIINKNNQEDGDGSDLYVFKDLIDHRKKGNQYIVQVKCDSGETTWELMKLIKECDPYTLAKQTLEMNITELKRWKWTKRFTRNPQHFVRLTRTINAAMKA